MLRTVLRAVYVLSTCCVAIESSVERPRAEEKSSTERQRKVRDDAVLSLELGLN